MNCSFRKTLERAKLNDYYLIFFAAFSMSSALLKCADNGMQRDVRLLTDAQENFCYAKLTADNSMRDIKSTEEDIIIE